LFSLDSSHLTTLVGALNGELRAASSNDENIFARILILFACDYGKKVVTKRLELFSMSASIIDQMCESSLNGELFWVISRRNREK
jgi:hypothetical protein